MKNEMEMNVINYYDNFISYVKIIMGTIAKENLAIAKEENENIVVEDNIAKDIIMRNIYNYYFNSKSQNCEGKSNLLMTEMIITTALFENKLYTLADNEKKVLIRVMYDEYLRPIMCNFSNGDISASLKIFEVMNDKIQAFVGYKVLYGIDEISLNKYKRGI